MKKEDKELLLQDLSMRLPYGVKCQAHNGTLICVNANNGIAVVQTDRGVRQVLIVNLKPYLRPLSSMTDEEKKDLLNYVVSKDSKYFEVCSDGSITDISPDVQDFKSFELKWINFHPNTTSRNIGWLLKNHFDFCDLIPKGLALEAPKDMYNEIKEEKK